MAATALEAAAPQIAVDDDVEGEIFDSDVASDTTSLKTFALRYDYMHGRRYQDREISKYLLPNDQEEQGEFLASRHAMFNNLPSSDFLTDRLDLDHHTWKLSLDGKHYLAPVNEPKKVLDLGCGTGIWAIEVADENPGARIVGTDLSAVQPAFMPSNVEFQVENVCSKSMSEVAIPPLDGLTCHSSSTTGLGLQTPLT